MNRSCRIWRVLLLSLVSALICWLPVTGAQAAVTCSASMTSLNFGNVDVVSNIGLTTTASLTYSCTNSATTAETVTACFSIGNPYGAVYNNRWMTSGANLLNFQIYQDPANSQMWGTIYSASVTPPKITISIPASGTTGPKTLPVYGTVKSSQTVPSGSYTASYGTGDTAMTFSTGSNTTCQGTSVVGGFPFTVSATTPKSCVVTAGTTSDIQLGAVDATAANIMGNNTFGVQCTVGTPYFIGLQPSNNSTTGAGVMAAMNVAPVTGNTDSVPYQLRSAAGIAGTIWGNTATSTAVGNGVAGTGTGVKKNVTVYATAPSANFTPDSYQDTVTVNVRY